MEPVEEETYRFRRLKHVSPEISQADYEQGKSRNFIFRTHKENFKAVLYDVGFTIVSRQDRDQYFSGLFSKFYPLIPFVK